MNSKSHPYSDLIQNLKDAGCCDSFIERFQLLDGKRAEKKLELLSEHRRILLDGIHGEQNKLDCLDYLIVQIQKEHTENKKKAPER